MIVTVTPNPAMDITLHAPVLRPGQTHRVRVAARQPGGKGINTAAVLAAMGVAHRAVAAVDGGLAARWEEELRARGVDPLVVPVPEPFRTRSSTAVVDDDGAATVFNEQGQAPPAEVVDRLADLVLDELTAPAGAPEPHPGSAVLALCGSMPEGGDLDPWLELVRRALEVGAAVVVDGTGEWLRQVLPLGPTLVKPNAAEAAATTGQDDPARAAEALVRAGALAALVSCGGDGVLLDTGEQQLSARPGARLQGNPTGAGDAATAAVAHHLSLLGDAPADGLRGLAPETLRALLRDVVGWSAAAVLEPAAGQVDPVRAREQTAAAVLVDPEAKAVVLEDPEPD